MECRNEHYKTYILEESKSWKGDGVGLSALHKRLYTAYESKNKCEECGREPENKKLIHWANVTGKYEMERINWKRLCAWCHMKLDGTSIQFQKYEKV